MRLGIYCVAGLLLAAPDVHRPRKVIEPDRIPVVGRYGPVVAALTTLIKREMRERHISAVSIALLDGGKPVWADGFGFADPAHHIRATAQTVYRVGSVSKLFTDIGVMQLVEKGLLDLDAPISKYLPEFHPTNPFGTAITLRQLMSHRSGLVREPPTGNYFDDSDPILAHMVESLNQTALVYAPESHTKYSNAGIGTVGYVLEKTQGQAFRTYLSRQVLEPMGLGSSAFEPKEPLMRRLAKAVMWTRDGRDFAAPNFQLGMAPAGSMYSTVLDLSRFMQVLFRRGKGAKGKIVSQSALEQMWTPQFAPAGTKEGYGIGFRVSQIEGHRVVGHGGAIYGFATELRTLPDDGIGVVVIGTRDGTNHVMARLAETAVEMVLAAGAGKPLRLPPHFGSVPAMLGRTYAGHFRNATKVADIRWRETSDGHDANPLPGARAGVLYLTITGRDLRNELRRVAGDTLIIDDEFSTGPRVLLTGDRLMVGTDSLTRADDPIPPPPPAPWVSLIGEYGWDHNTLFIHEQAGHLQALIEWFTDYPLTQQSDSVFQFPDWGLYSGESLIFHRGGSGVANSVRAASVRFARRVVGPEPGAPQLKVPPQRPIDVLRREALAAKPPVERGSFRASDLVELITLDSTIKLDIRYATTNNAFDAVFYSQARAFLQRPAAEALVRVHRALAKIGYGVMIHDGYRPWYVTKMFWDGARPQDRIFVADPSQGSKHNRGAAVDLTLYDRTTGQPVEMPGTYDEFSNRSFPDYPGGTSRQTWYRELLRRTMEAEGFGITETEWWHFDYQDWKKYRIGTLRFEELGK